MELSIACSSYRRRCFVLECPELLNRRRHTGAHCFICFLFIHHNEPYWNTNGRRIHDKSNFYPESTTGLGDELSIIHDVTILYDSFQLGYPLIFIDINIFFAIFFFVDVFSFLPSLDKRTLHGWISSLTLVPHSHW